MTFGALIVLAAVVCALGVFLTTAFQRSAAPPRNRSDGGPIVPDGGHAREKHDASDGDGDGGGE